MSGPQCPTLKSTDDPQIILSNYSTSVGTHVLISCRKFAHHVTPSAVTCLSDGSSTSWDPTPSFSCEYSLDSKEKLLLGVFVGSGILFLLCVICIAACGVFGDRWQAMWTRYNRGKEHFDNQVNYPIESRRYRERLSGSDDPRREYSPYGSMDKMERYDYNRMMHEKNYKENLDFWRYDDRYDPINRSFDRNDYYESRGYKPPIWYTREIIEYMYDVGDDRCFGYKFCGVPRPPDKLISTEMPHYRAAILDEPTSPIIEELVREPVAIMDSPALNVDHESEKFIPDLDNEPDYAETEYIDLGFYAIDKDRSSNVELGPVRDNAHFDYKEPLYAKPIKPKVKVMIEDSERRVHSGNYDNQIVPYRSNSRHLQLRTNPESRDPIVDENLDYMLYRGKGRVTEVYDNISVEIPRVSVNKE